MSPFAHLFLKCSKIKEHKASVFLTITFHKKFKAIIFIKFRNIRLIRTIVSRAGLEKLDRDISGKAALN